MRILVDGMNLALPHGTGIAVYSRNFMEQADRLGWPCDLLLGGSDLPLDATLTRAEWIQAARPQRLTGAFRGLQRLAGACRTLAFANVHALATRDIATPTDAPWQARNFHVNDVFANAVSAFRRFGKFTTLDIPGVDIAHWTAPIPIRIRNARNVYTIHDLVPLKFPELVTGNQRMFRVLCEEIAKHADHILTVSECSRQDIIKILNAPSGLVTNTYQTLEAEFWQYSSNSDVSILDNIGLNSRQYFLFFGAIEPKKNVGRILAAHQSADIALPLVVVGTHGWGSDEDHTQIAKLQAQGDGRFKYIDHLPRASLLQLITHARATVFPSIYEGFGLPALESMALGTPVIASNRGSLPEIVGPHGITVDPLDTGAIRDAMRLLEHDNDLWRNLAKAGLEHAQSFSPAAYRRRLGALFQQLMA